jgi:hypothetical protein
MVARRRLEQLLRFYFAYLPPFCLAYLSQTTGSLESCAPQTVPLSLMHNRLLRRQDRSEPPEGKKKKAKEKSTKRLKSVLGCPHVSKRLRIRTWLSPWILCFWWERSGIEELRIKSQEGQELSAAATNSSSLVLVICDKVSTPRPHKIAAHT